MLKYLIGCLIGIVLTATIAFFTMSSVVSNLELESRVAQIKAANWVLEEHYRACKKDPTGCMHSHRIKARCRGYQKL